MNLKPLTKTDKIYSTSDGINKLMHSGARTKQCSLIQDGNIVAESTVSLYEKERARNRLLGLADWRCLALCWAPYYCICVQNGHVVLNVPVEFASGSEGETVVCCYQTHVCRLLACSQGSLNGNGRFWWQMAVARTGIDRTVSWPRCCLQLQSSSACRASQQQYK